MASPGDLEAAVRRLPLLVGHSVEFDWTYVTGAAMCVVRVLLGPQQAAPNLSQQRQLERDAHASILARVRATTNIGKAPDVDVVVVWGSKPDIADQLLRGER